MLRVKWVAVSSFHAVLFGKGPWWELVLRQLSWASCQHSSGDGNSLEPKTKSSHRDRKQWWFYWVPTIVSWCTKNFAYIIFFFYPSLIEKQLTYITKSLRHRAWWFDWHILWNNYHDRVYAIQGVSAGNVFGWVRPAIMISIFGQGNYLSSEDRNGGWVWEHWDRTAGLLLYPSEAVGWVSQLPGFSG